MKILIFLKKFAIALSYGLLGILSAAVFLFSLVTVISFRQYEQNDLFDIARDNVPLLLLSMAAVLAVTGIVLWRMDRKGGKGEDRPAFPWPMMIFAGAMSLFLVFVIRGNATNDALQLDDIMQAFSAGDYGALREGGYLFVYPFQITYVFIGQLIAALCGPSDFLVYQLLNVVSILSNLYFLYRIAWELFRSRKVCAVLQILSMGCWFYYVFATFVYADLWSFAFQTAALWLEIVYLNRRRLRYAVGAGLCIAAATLLKTNCYVALIAMVLILLTDAVRENPCGTTSGKAVEERTNGRGLLRAALLCVMLVVLTKGAQSAVNAAAAREAGLERMPSGVPAAAYFAMGMQETEGKYGWYNGTNVGLFREAGYDPEETVRAAKRSMAESIGEFRNSKRYLIRFYAGKFLSQWGDPTCDGGDKAAHGRALPACFVADLREGQQDPAVGHECDAFTDLSGNCSLRGRHVEEAEESGALDRFGCRASAGGFHRRRNAVSSALGGIRQVHDAVLSDDASALGVGNLPVSGEAAGSRAGMGQQEGLTYAGTRESGRIISGMPEK